MDDFEPYRTDVLFLLVGGNPLPNFVAATLLAKTGATVVLLHTDGPKNTADIAERIRWLLNDKRPDLTIVPRGVPDSDGERIESRMQTLLDAMAPVGTVGLNYTGGTKAMAVHTYHVLHQSFPQGCFSYLDPRTLSMWVHLGEDPMQVIAVGRRVELKLTELFSLHGWRVERNPSLRPEVDSRLLNAIAYIHQRPQGFQQWRTWIETLGKSPVLPDLKTYPSLKPLMNALSEVCGGRTLSELDLARAVGDEELVSCSKFLKGSWLEHYTLVALQRIAQDLHLGDIVAALLLKKTDARAGEPTTELDIATICGYHLFAVSCMNTSKRAPAKLHLFEAFARARQLGGDEARLALVCYVEDPDSLRQEVEDALDTEGRIRVFGPTDLSDLTCFQQRLAGWFSNATGEVQ